MQLLINIGISTCLFALAAAGISLVYAATRGIPFTLAAAMSAAAYVGHGLNVGGLPIAVAAIGGTVVGAAVACILDWVVIQPLGRKSHAAWSAVAGSLGAYIVLQAACGMAFGEAGRTFPFPRDSFAISSGRVTDVQVAIAVASSAAVGSLLGFLEFTRQGLAIRGLSSNAELCVLLGMKSGSSEP